MEDAWVDEDSTKLATEEQLICAIEEKIVGVEHHNTVILSQAPCVELVQCQLEPIVRIGLAYVGIVHVLHSHHPDSIFRPAHGDDHVFSIGTSQSE